MYSIQENLDSSEFSGWINQDLLLKDSRRSTTATRKRSYDLTNVELEEDCEDLRRRVLRPRHNAEPQFSNGASRTRPIRSNRSRRRPNVTIQQDIPTNEDVIQSLQGSTSVTDINSPSSANDLSLFQALASYSWPQNYLLAHTDPSINQSLQTPSYSPLQNLQLNPRLPSFDPWVLHNYLLASSNYSLRSSGHVSSESSRDDFNRNMSQLGYPSMVPENALSPNFIWHYPFLFNPALYPLQAQVTRPPELSPNISTSSHNIDIHSDLSYLFRPPNPSQREILSDSNDNHHIRNDLVHSGMYPNELPNFNNHVLPSPFNYVPMCPYHNTNHLLHHNQQSSRQITNNGSNLPDNSLQYPQHSFSTFQHPQEMSFGNYWPQITPSIRPVSYPINSSNIDTLLHLAAHFEQRKRGITREELDRLPTHRYKTAAAISDKLKQKEKNCTEKSKVNGNEDLEKCLVCLDDFEIKQSIRTLRCHHEFHAKCIDKWLKINRTCPLCRADAFDGSAQKDGP